MLLTRTCLGLTGCLVLIACPGPDTATTETDPTGSSTNTSTSTGTSTSDEPTGSTGTTQTPTTDTTTETPTTGDPTTGDPEDLGPARVYYGVAGPMPGQAAALRLVTVAAGEASPPTTVLAAPDGGYLVLSSFEAGGRWLGVTGAGDSKRRLWVVDLTAATAQEVALAPDIDLLGEPSFTPDGAHMFFPVRFAGTNFDLHMCTSEPGGGCVPQKFAPPLPPMTDSSFGVSFSSDSTRVAWQVHVPEGGQQLLVGEIDTPGAATPLATYPENFTDFGAIVFAPDNQTLYYSADIQTNSQYEYFAVDISSDPPGPPVPISPPPDPVGRGRLAPDVGALLWWSGDGLHGDLARISLNATTAGAPLLLNTSGPGHAYTGRFQWTPDSTRVVYLADHETPGFNQLYVVDAGDDPPAPLKLNAPLGQGGDVNDSHFNPDASKLLYFAADGPMVGREAFLADLDAPGEVVKLSAPLPPGGSLSGSHAWSPDGTRLVYHGTQDSPDTSELFLVDLRDGPPKPPVKLNHLLPPDHHVRYGHSFAPDGNRVFYKAELTPEHEALYMVEIGLDGQPAPSMLLSQPDEEVTVVHVLPPL